jgi:hypothetical protein
MNHYTRGISTVSILKVFERIGRIGNLQQMSGFRCDPRLDPERPGGGENRRRPHLAKVPNT